jgi:hypothetical protein
MTPVRDRGHSILEFENLEFVYETRPALRYEDLEIRVVHRRFRFAAMAQKLLNIDSLASLARD